MTPKPAFLSKVLQAQQLTIDVSRTSIAYEEDLSTKSGYLKIDMGDPPIVAPNGDTLLHLLFFLIHTAEGRQLLAAHGPAGWAGATTADQARMALKAALHQRFPTIADDRLEIVVDVHFAADEYVSAYKTNDSDRQKQQQAIYSQKILAILGALHDDAMGHEFSMVW